MFQNNSKTYKLTPSVQIYNNVFTAGYTIEIYEDDLFKFRYFSNKTKNTIMEDIKRDNGFKTKAESIIDTLLSQEDE